MRAIDMQVYCSTKKGALVKDPAMLARAQQFFKTETQVTLFKTEEQMADDLRKAGIKAVICPPTIPLLPLQTRDIGEVRELHDYVAQLKRDYPDSILGSWVGVSPKWGIKGKKELERCIKDLGFFGVAACGALSGVPLNDKQWYPYYDMCAQARVPVKLWVGFLGLGAGLPGGGGIRLYTENPIPHVDDVAAQFPELTIIGAHVPWPFHHEMTAVLVHKANVYCETHGWSPKYFPSSFKRDINGRLQDKIMFGSEYPFFSYERLFRDWEAEGYKPEILEKVYYKNAQRIFGLSKDKESSGSE